MTALSAIDVQKARPYLELMRLDKPVGTFLLLWPTLAALWLAADGSPPWHLVLVFVLGTFVMRSAGCVINDWADRHIDGEVERTRNRPLVTGAVDPNHALVLFAVLLLIAAFLVLFLNIETLVAAAFGAGVAVLYPFTKRWTYLPQAFLGFAFSWGILLAWTAVTGTVTPEAGVLFAGSCVWIVAYDTLYAMVDREDDIKIGVKSTALLFAELDRLMVGIMQMMAVVAFLLLGLRLEFFGPYFLGVAACAGLFIYQQLLIKKRQRAACFKAFRNNTWVGFALFTGTVAEYALTSLLT